MVNLVDFFGGTLVIFTVAVLEVVVIVWWYGEYIDNIFLRNHLPLIFRH